MTRRIPMNSGDEFDALTRWRHSLYWKPGERSAIKRRYRRRERRQAKRALTAMVYYPCDITLLLDGS